jgi:hypothetical protein
MFTGNRAVGGFGVLVFSSRCILDLQAGLVRRDRRRDHALELLKVLLEFREQQVGEVFGDALDERPHALK